MFANERRFVYLDRESYNTAGLELLDISDPESPTYRLEKKQVVGRDGFLYNNKESVDGYNGFLMFETRTDAAFNRITNALYPGWYGEIATNTEYPLHRMGMVRNFHVDEMGFAENSAIRVVTFNVEFQPYVYSEPQTYTISNGTGVTNPGAATDDFQLVVRGNTGSNGHDNLKIMNYLYTDAMKISVVNRITIDNLRKNIYDNSGALRNDFRKEGFYFTLENGWNEFRLGPLITGATLTVKWRYWA